MALNKDTHTPQTVILTKAISERIVKLAKENHRSVSAQIAYMIEQQLKEDSE